MKVVIRITRNFKNEAKALIKKYPSLNNDLAILETQLKENPKTGVIGELDVKEKETTVNLISIYDKSVTATISDKELSSLIESFRLDNK